MAKKARPKGSKKQQFKFKKGDKVMEVDGDGTCLTVGSVWEREKVILRDHYFTISYEVAVAIVGGNKIYKEDELLEYSDGLADLMDRVSELEGKKKDEITESFHSLFAKSVASEYLKTKKKWWKRF